MRVPVVLSLVVFSLIALASCNSGNSIKIGGTYSGENDDYLHINRIEVDQLIYIDSIKVGNDGSFKTKLSNDIPEFYSIGFDGSEFVTIIAYPGDNIVIDFNEGALQENYKVSGSKESEDIRLLDEKLAETLFILDSLSSEFTALPEGSEYDDDRSALEETYTETITAQRMHNIEYIIENINSFASIKALYQRLDENAYVLYKTTDAQYLKLVSDTLNAFYPTSKQAISLAQNLKNEISAMNMNKITSIAAEADGVEMDMNLESVDGSRIKLSSFKNKSYVLLSFWSTQSKDCIANNIQMKEYYKAYKNKGFEIYQVNIDEDAERWRQYVKFDDIPWVSVREDEASNPVNAMKYNVSSVPANYLIDINGEIIGKNLFGRSLQIRLNQVFN